MTADRVGTTCQRGMDIDSSDPLHLSHPPICSPLSVAGNMHRASAPLKSFQGSDIETPARAACVDDVLGLQS